MKIKIVLFTSILMLFVLTIHAQHNLWVGQSFKCDATSAVMGLTSDVSWSVNGGYISLSGSGFYRNATVTQYYSGGATVTCSWKYRLYSGDRWRNQSKSWTITCQDNPVSISPTSLTLGVGEIGSVSYTHKFSNSYTSAANAYFSSTNTRVATVSNTGVVTAVAPGTAYINVYSKISSDSPYCLVTVKNIEPTKISLPSSISLSVGGTQTLTPSLTPTNAQKSFTWSSDNTDVATVSSNGVVLAVKEGNATIKVTTSNGLSATCSVRVLPAPEKVSIEPQNVSITEGYGYQITPKLNPDGTTTEYTWKSDDFTIVTATTSGYVLARKVGETTITCTTQNGLTATCTIYVNEAETGKTATAIKSKISKLDALITKTQNKLSN